MKTSVVVLLVLVLCICCKPKPQPPDPPAKVATFSGKVVDSEGKELDGLKVDINGIPVESANGSFKGTVDSTGRYVVNIRKRGYGLLSKVFNGSMIDRKYVLVKGVKTVGNPTQVIVATGNTGCNPSDLSRVNWESKKFESVPRVLDASGNLVDFGFTSPEIAQAFAGLRTTTPPCNPGGRVSIPGNSLIASNNQPPQGNVVVSFTTVDLYSEDGMPGDYSYRNDATGEAGYMVSMGAVLIDIYSEDEKTDYNLKEKTTATLQIPVDPMQVKLRKEIPETIPFLTYDSKSGYWKSSGEGKLNKKGMYYEAEVSHFSEFNMDIEKTTPACVRFIQPPDFNVNNTRPYKVASLTASGALKYSITGTVKDLQLSGGNGGNGCLTNATGSGTTWRGYQMLYNLPDNNSSDPVMVAFFDEASNDPLGLYLIKTNATYAPGAKPLCDYAACATIPAINFTDPILFASLKTPGNNAKTKWVMNLDPTTVNAATVITYEVIKIGGPVGCTVDCANDPTGGGCPTGCSATALSALSALPVSGAGADDPRLPATGKEFTILNWAVGDRVFVRASATPQFAGNKYKNSMIVTY